MTPRAVTGVAGAVVLMVLIALTGGRRSSEPGRLNQDPGKKKTMATPNDTLIERLSSPDPDAAELALAELVRLGRASTPGLLAVLKTGGQRARELAAAGLSDLGDPASAEGLAASLEDGSEKVRAYAATGLARLHDPRALTALIRTFDDYPDVLHHPYTLAVYTLMNWPPAEALPAVAPLLKAQHPLTRERALAVLKAGVGRLAGPPVEWDLLWAKLGRYDPHAPAATRDRAADQWAEWIRGLGTRHSAPGTRP